jgi:hypothetical protein
MLSLATRKSPSVATKFPTTNPEVGGRVSA